jgi:hypothetical protein
MAYTVDAEPFSRGAGTYVDQLVRGILLAGHQEASLARHLTLENAILRRRSTPARELVRRLSIASCCDAGVPRTARYHTSGSSSAYPYVFSRLDSGRHKALESLRTPELSNLSLSP